MLKVSHLHGFNARRASSSDADFANVVLLMGFEGADGSTTFTDESPVGHTCTTHGNAQVDTAQFKYGTSSALFDGSGDEIRIGGASNPSWEFGTGDFTIEFWFRPVSSTACCILGTSNLVNYAGFYIEKGSGTILINKLFGQIVSVSWSPTFNQWYHVACVRSSGTVTFYIDGTSIGGGSWTENIGQDAMSLGGLGQNTVVNLNGHIDELRITKGVARYTGNFTPPTEAFPRS